MSKILVADGSMVDPYNLHYEDIKLDVVAHALSQINRFTGHTEFPYSVGQHTLNLAVAVKRFYSPTKSKLQHEMIRAALAHDMSEVFFNDMSAPIKVKNQEYREAEHTACKFICNVLEVDELYIEVLNAFDKRISKNELNALFPASYHKVSVDYTAPLNDKYIYQEAFKEHNWRVVRTALWYMYKQVFSSHTAFVPFWERKEYGKCHN